MWGGRNKIELFLKPLTTFHILHVIRFIHISYTFNVFHIVYALSS
jgi:hypothetical protein